MLELKRGQNYKYPILKALELKITKKMFRLKKVKMI